MKYAFISPYNSVVRVLEEPLQNIPTGCSIAEVSDEAASAISAGLATIPPVVHFYENGQLVTPEEKKDQLRPQITEQLQELKNSKPPVKAEKWIERQGFTALKVVALMDIEGKLAAANKTSAKLEAVRQWLDGLTASHAAMPIPRNNWPAAPFRFEETMQEAIAAINS